uniref:DUF4220 domain-containing protein n=1 Tax=Vitis vinifera TaxID=29760 RepID=A5BA63_VITVI|nr:hypothetical protein VITISV_036395 [Vitis vinifera]
MPMFVTGLIKCGEKTGYLRSGSYYHFRKTTISHPLPVPVPVPGPELDHPTRGCACAAFMAEYDGVSYAALIMTECDCKKAEGYCVSCQPESEKSEVENTPSPDPRNESVLVAAPLQKAFEFFPKFKRLFTDVVLGPTDLEQSKSFFNNISWKQAFEVIEIELGFIYDIFYTKPMKVYDEWGLVRRFICLFSEISTFIGFMIIDKHEYSTTDVIITWLLLVGAIVQEIYSIILLCSSDWTMNWLNKQGKTRVTRICKAISSCRLPYLFPANKRWSDSMARYNLISYSLKNLPIKFSDVWKFFCIPRMLDECSSKNSDVPKYLKILIFEQLQEKSRHAPGIKEAKELCADRGKRTLEEMKCFSTLHWSVEREFDECILVWHLATDLCYDTDLNKKSSPAKNSNREASKLLSDYMVYLLLKRPLMLPPGIGQIRFRDSCAKATKIFQTVKDRNIQSCKRFLLQVNTEIPPLKAKGDGSKSVLLDACRLAKSLQSLESEKEWNNEKKWEMMSHVWVEMLCYAACHCPRNEHAKELTQGGELLTHVWLLMAHFGITEHVCQD